MRDSVSSGYPNIEKRVKNTTRSGVFSDGIRGVWIADKTLSPLNRNKRRSIIVKIFDNYDRVPKLPSRL